MAEPTPIGIECKSCGATIEVGIKQKTAICPYSASPSVLERPPKPDRPNPTFVLTVLVTKNRAVEIMRGWIKNLTFSFRRADLVKNKLPEMRGMYLPAYLYSATTNTSYSVEIGERYYTGTGKNRRRETDWCQLTGHFASYLAVILVSASRGTPNTVLEEIEPFDLRALHRYRPALISGWLAEEASRTKDDCFKLAHQEAQALRGHYVIAVTGQVRHRPAGMVNPKLATGQIEVYVDDLEILNKSQTPPFPGWDEAEVPEVLRLKPR